MTPSRVESEEDEQLRSAQERENALTSLLLPSPIRLPLLLSGSQNWSVDAVAHA